MPRTNLRRTPPTRLAPVLLVLACGALAGCGGGGGEATGNSVEMRDMEVVDGTVNDSMTDLDAVRADGVGAVGNAGNASRPAGGARSGDEAAGEDTETVAAE